MACSVTKGKARYCKIQPGGIEKVYVIDFFDANAADTLTATAGVLTASSGLTSKSSSAGTYFPFTCDPYLSSMNQTIVVNESGGVGFQQDLELVFKGISGAADLEMLNLANGTYQIAILGNDGIVYFCGLKKGLICTGGSFGHNGDKALSDNQAYTLTFSCIEQSPAQNCGTDTNFTGQGDVSISTSLVTG